MSIYILPILYEREKKRDESLSSTWNFPFKEMRKVYH